MNASEKVSYLHGLMDGLQLDETKPETKLFKAICDTMETLAAEVGELKIESERMDDYLDELDHDLGDLENDFYCDDDEDDYDEDDDDEEYCTAEDCDADCENCELTDCDKE